MEADAAVEKGHRPLGPKLQGVLSRKRDPAGVAVSNNLGMVTVHVERARYEDQPACNDALPDRVVCNVANLR